MACCKDPLTPGPLGRRGDRGEDGFYCPRPFGGEGGAHPALSPAGAGRVRGSRLLSIITWDTTLARISHHGWTQPEGRGFTGCGKTLQCCYPELIRCHSERSEESRSECFQSSARFFVARWLLRMTVPMSFFAAGKAPALEFVHLFCDELNDKRRETVEWERLRPRPFGGEGGRPPAFSSAGDGQVRGSNP